MESGHVRGRSRGRYIDNDFTEGAIPHRLGRCDYTAQRIMRLKFLDIVFILGFAFSTMTFVLTIHYMKTGLFYECNPLLRFFIGIGDYGAVLFFSMVWATLATGYYYMRKREITPFWAYAAFSSVFLGLFNFLHDLIIIVTV